MRTLTDLLGAGTSRAESALGHSAPADAWSSLIDTVHNLPSASLPPPSAVQAGAAHAEGKRGTDVDAERPPIHIPPSAYSMHGLTHLPADLALKTRMRIISPTSLVWTRMRPPCRDHTELRNVFEDNDRTMKECELENGNASSTRTNPSTSLRNSARSLFFRRLMNFQFPTSPLSSSLASNWHNIFASDSNRASQSDGTIQHLRKKANARLAMWQSALQSLYYAFRHDKIRQFYVILSNATIVFKRLNDDNMSVAAVLAPATPGLRSLLSDYIVPFTICRLDAESSDQVCVRVDSEFGIHTLYNFIMCAAHKLSGATDVPTVICDKPFREGTAVSATVQCTKEARVLVDSASSTSATQYSVQVSGILTPRQIEGMCDALVYTQCAQYTMTLDTERRCIGVNNMNITTDDGEASTPKPLIGDQVLTRVASFPDTAGLFASVRKGDG